MSIPPNAQCDTCKQYLRLSPSTAVVHRDCPKGSGHLRWLENVPHLPDGEFKKGTRVKINLPQSYWHGLTAIVQHRGSVSPDVLYDHCWYVRGEPPHGGAASFEAHQMVRL